MANTVLDRFKVMLEEHTGGTVTQRQYMLRDVIKMMNEEPGTVGEYIISKEVYANKERVEIGKLPKGAILKSVCIKEVTMPPEGVEVSFGTGDEANSFGKVEREKPKEGQPQQPGHLHKQFDDGKELEQEQTLYAKTTGLKDGKKSEAFYKLVLVYEKFNELK